MFARLRSTRGSDLMVGPIRADQIGAAVAKAITRPYGKPHGSHVADLVNAHNKPTFVLCWKCAHKFDHKRSRYYLDRRFPNARGVCEGCRDFVNEGHMYIHESYLTGPGGRTVNGQCWTPR